MRAVLYLRASTDRQETSCSDQRSELTSYAASHGYSIVGEYVDDGVSGDATEKRFSFQRMISDATSGRFNMVLCWDQDRFGRFDPIEGGFWIKPLRDNGIILETMAQGRINWTDFGGRIIWAVTQEAKHAFLRDLARNTSRGVRASIQAGMYFGGAPYGYRKQEKRLILGPPGEVAAVRRVFELRLQGYGHRAIGLMMAAEGHPKNNGEWNTGMVRYILAREAYTGCQVTSKVKRGKYERLFPVATRFENTHEPIIDRDTWIASRALAAAPRPKTRDGKPVAPFSGMLLCSMCREPMHCWPYRGVRGYACGTYHVGRGCGWCHVKEDHLIEKFAEAIARVTLRGIKALELGISELIASRQPATNHAKRIAALTGQIERAGARLATIDDAALPAFQKKVQQMIAERDSLLAASVTSQPEVDPGDYAVWLYGLPQVLRESADRTALRQAVVGLIAEPVIAHIELARETKKRRFYTLKDLEFRLVPIVPECD